MARYIFQHDIPTEADRMDQMSDVLDDVSRNHLRRIPVEPNWTCLEVGAGNGSLSYWLAKQVPEGKVDVTDLNPDLITGDPGPNTSVGKLDVVNDDIEEGVFDLVFLRAVLHHIPEREKAISKLIRALKPGGWLFVHEPDLHPSLVTPNETVRLFWSQFFPWAAGLGIDYTTGGQIPPMLKTLGLTNISAWGDTAIYQGGSSYALWLQLSIAEVADKLLAAGITSEDTLQQFNEASADPNCWHMSVSFVGTVAQKTGS